MLPALSDIVTDVEMLDEIDSELVPVELESALSPLKLALTARVPPAAGVKVQLATPADTATPVQFDGRVIAVPLSVALKSTVPPTGVGVMVALATTALPATAVELKPTEVEVEMRETVEKVAVPVEARKSPLPEYVALIV